MFNQNGDNGVLTKVALYARVSTEDQTERETIQNQVNVAGTLCPAMGLEIVDSYLDDGVSGMIPLGQRPEGARLLEDATQGKFQQVVVYRLDRIGRKALVILSAWETLKEKGVALRSLTEPFDTAQPFGEFVMGILAMVAGYERDSIVSRTTEGRRRKAREGKWTGGRAPLGYRVVGGYLEIDEEEADLIRRIFRQYTEERLSGWRISTQLNGEGVLTQSSRRGFTTSRIKHVNHWDHVRILSIIKNETYAGVRHVGKRGKGSIIDQEVPAIIPRETWDRAQALTRSNWSNSPRNAKRDYLLRGLLFCGECNRRYIGYVTNGGKNAYYKCGRHGCPNRNIIAQLAEDIIWNDILEFVQNPGPVLKQLQQQMAMTDSGGTEEELRKVEAAQVRLLEDRQRIIYLVRKGLVSDEEGETQLTVTGQERDALAARKASLEALMQRKDGQQTQLMVAETLLRQLQESAETADNTTKRQVIEVLVDQATVNTKESGELNLQITYRFEQPGDIADNTLTRRTRCWAPMRYTWATLTVR